MKPNLKAKIVISLILAGISLFVVLSAAKLSLETYVQNAEDLSDEFETIVHWMKVGQTYQYAEIQQLEYVLTGKKRFLDNYVKSKNLIKEEIVTLRKSIHPRLENYLKSYEHLLQRKFALMDRTVASRETGRLAAMQILFHGEGREVTDKLKALRDELRSVLGQSVKEKLSLTQAGTLSATSSMNRLSWFCVALFAIIGAVLIHDAHKRQLYEKALVEAEGAAIRSSQFKSQFLAHMSHEIRTPLNSIIAMGDLLEESPLQESDQKLVSTLRRAGKSLLRIVNEILDLSKVEAGALTLENIDFDLQTLLEDIRNLCGAQAQEKGITFLIENTVISGQAMRGDSTRLQQVLMNLIGNAIKFTSKGQVVLRVSQTKNKFVQFSVEDTGVGLSDEAIRKLFVPFQQAESSTTRIYGGTGLGLVICKQIVELMGGSLSVSSELEKGSTFSFEVPIAVESIAQKLPIESNKVRYSNFYTTSPEKLKILVADDVKENHEVLRLLLKAFDWDIRFATTGLEAVECFEKEKFHLILMDMQMPIMDGRAATKKIRDLETKTSRKRTPIIALSAEAFPEEKESSLQSGCDLYLTKPFRKQELLNAFVDLGFCFETKRSA